MGSTLMGPLLSHRSTASLHTEARSATGACSTSSVRMAATWSGGVLSTCPWKRTFCCLYLCVIS